jgi:hypothetical protein
MDLRNVPLPTLFPLVQFHGHPTMSSSRYPGDGEPKNDTSPILQHLSTTGEVQLAIAYVLQEDQDLDPDEVSKKAEEASNAFSYWSEQRGIRMRNEGDDDQIVKSHIHKVFLVSDELHALHLACLKWPLHYVKGPETHEQKLKRAQDGIAHFKTKVDEILKLGEDGESVGTGPSAASESRDSSNASGTTGASREPTQ